MQGFLKYAKGEKLYRAHSGGKDSFNMNNIRAYNSQNLSLVGGMDNPFFWEEVILSLPVRNDLLTFFPTSSCFSSSCKTRTTELQLVRMVGAYVSLVSLTPTEGWEPC